VKVFWQGVRIHRYIRRVAAMFIVPFLVMLAGGNVHALFRCNMEQVARPTCCCPKTQESTGASLRTAVASACCCTIETSDAAPAGEARAQANRFESVQTFPTPVAVLAHVAPLLASPRVMRAGAHSPSPPNPPSLLSLKTSFLL